MANSSGVDSKLISVTPDIVPAAYAAGDVIGTLRTVVGGVGRSSGISELVSVSIIDKANQKSAIDLYFFDRTVSSIGADNAAFSIVDADAANLLAVISILGGDYVSIGTDSAIASAPNLGQFLKSIPDSKDIFMAVVSRGAPTYTSATDLVIKLGLMQH